MSTVPIRKSLRLNSRAISDKEAAEIKLRAEKNEKKKKKRNLRIAYANFKKRQAETATAADDSTKSLINSYLTEINDLKKKVDELEKQNSEYKKYTHDMVRNPIVSRHIDPFVQPYLLLRNGEKLHIPTNNRLNDDNNYEDLKSNNRRFLFEKRFRHIPLVMNGEEF